MNRSIAFIANSAAEALARINVELGPDAVVLSVREVPRNALARWWGKPRIEVVAHVPVKPAEALMEAEGRLGEVLETIRRLNRQSPAIERPDTDRPSHSICPSLPPSASEPDSPLEPWLKDWGLAPCWSRRVADRVEAMLPESASERDERRAAREVLAGWWRRNPSSDSRGLHVFVGAAGCGKTTVLSKWMAQAELLSEQTVRVWRLDGTGNHSAEGLMVCADVLGIPVERHWRRPTSADRVDIGFVDLPGVDWRDGEALGELKAQLERLGPVQVHLVLNAAYDSALALEQIEAFSWLDPVDMIFTHMDEERRFGKLWNCVLETDLSVRLLGFGRSVPGTLRAADANLLLPGEFP